MRLWVGGVRVGRTVVVLLRWRRRPPVVVVVQAVGQCSFVVDHLSHPWRPFLSFAGTGCVFVFGGETNDATQRDATGERKGALHTF